MKKTVIYRYLGTNGIIESPIHLEDTYYVRLLRLQADEQKVLTKDGETFVRAALVPEEELDLWYEVDLLGQD